MLLASIMGKLRRKAKLPASGSTYKGIALPREKARWVWMGLAGPAVAEVRTFWTKLRGIKKYGILLMAKLTIKELTSQHVGHDLAGCLDRLTTVLTTSYDDFIEGSQSQFQDLDLRIG